MKPRKANKRLSKLDELLADLSEGYSKGALHVRAAVEGAKVAVAHLRETIGSQASSSAAGKTGAGSHGAPKVKRKLSAAHRRAIQEGVRRRVAAKKAASATGQGATKKPRAASKKRVAKQPQ